MSQMDNMFIDACKNGQKGVAQTLLAKGDVDVNKRDAMGYTALHYACQKGARDLVSLLLAKGADACACSNDSVTPLHMCARNGNKDIIRMLVEASADLNATDRNGRTPLMGMASEGKVDAAKILLEMGADPSVADLKWVNQHIRRGHGLLGMAYPESGFYPDTPGVWEGDSPSYLYLVSAALGISDAEKPESLQQA